MTVGAKRRLTPEISRAQALAAARDILIEAGPKAVTLKAVSGRIGRTHANLLHHFGSAAGLQQALAGHLAETVCATIADQIRGQALGERDVRGIVDLAFDAFDAGGAGALASWMVMAGNENALDPIVASISALIDTIAPTPDEKLLMREDTLALVLMALGDAQLGAPLAGALGLPRRAARDLAVQLITGRIAAFTGGQAPVCC